MPLATPDQPVLGSAARSAADLAAELRREFERALFERYGQLPAQDPVLAALFHATALQLARVYDEAEQVFPEAVFDDLVSGLGMPPRAAHPAQTVVTFTGAATPELVTPDTPLVGISVRGEHLPFAVDVPVRVGPSRLVFAAVAEAGRLHVLPGAVLPADPAAPEGGPPAPLPPAVAPLPSESASMAPTLFLAFEVDDVHLSGLGLFIDVQGPDHPVARALARSAWHLLDEPGAASESGGGVVREALVLRSVAGPGGVRLLNWQHGAAAAPDDVIAGAALSPAAAGVYGALCWRWPEVPRDRRVLARTPRALAGVLPRVVPAGLAPRYDRPLAWIQVAIPAGTHGIAAAVQRVAAHCAPASNVEAFAERVDVGELGAVVAFRPEGARTRHAVAVLGVTGEQGERYADEADAAAGLGRGRYRARGGDLELRPARGPTGRFDRYVMVRLLYTDGARANGLQPGDVAGRGGRTGRVGFGAANLTVTRGGAGPPAYAPAKLRFAELLRTRERVVTPADVDIVARAFEPRVVGADVATAVELGDDGVPRRVEVVTVRVRHGDFVDPGAEFPALGTALERHLGARVALGTTLRVEVRAERRGPHRAPYRPAR